MGGKKKSLVSVNLDSESLINISVLCQVSDIENPQLHYRRAIKEYLDRNLSLYPPEKVKMLQTVERMSQK